MSANDLEVQEATLLFLHQLKLRPHNVVANVNALLEGEDFRLGLVNLIRQTPQEASLFDWKPPIEMEGA